MIDQSRRSRALAALMLVSILGALLSFVPLVDVAPAAAM